MRQTYDDSVAALLALGRAIDTARGEVVTAIALALNDYGEYTETSPFAAEEEGKGPRSGWSDKSLVMRRRPW
jgi:hypothetical protein